VYYSRKFYKGNTERDETLIDIRMDELEERSSLLIKDAETVDSTKSFIQKPKKKSQKEFNCFLLAIPAMFYLISCVLQNTALSKINSSTFMLLRSSLMVFTAILSKIFISKQIYAHHWFAMFTVVSGLAVVSYLASINREDKSHDNEATSSSSHLWYIFLVLLSQLSMACQYTYEAYFFENYTIDPFYMVGIQGLF